MSAGAAAAAAVQAITASGVRVRVEPEEFLGILQRQSKSLVVYATAGVFTTNYRT